MRSVMRKIMLYFLVGLILVGCAFADVTSWTMPGTATDAGGGDTSWFSLSNALVFDDTTATANADLGDYTNYLHLTNYSFSIPEGATIDGIQIEQRVRETGADIYMELVKNGARTGTIRAPSTTSSLANYSYGGSSDLWGTSWTADDINNISFGQAMHGEGKSGGNDVYIAWARIRVYYTPVADPVYPFFLNIVDNEGDFQDFGTVQVNFTVNGTNGTAGVAFDNENRSCTNTTGLSSNQTSISCSFSINGAGTYYYKVWALGSGSNNNYNESQTYSYTVSAAGTKDLRAFDVLKDGSRIRLGAFTNKLKLWLNTTLDVYNTSLFYGNVTVQAPLFIPLESSGFAKIDSNGQITGGNAIAVSDLPAHDSRSWNLSGSSVILANPSTKVGVGISSPAYSIDTNGSLNVNGSLCFDGACIGSWADVNLTTGGVTGTQNHIAFFNSGSTITNTSLYYNLTTGYVGIGMSVLSYALDVNGSINTNANLCIAGACIDAWSDVNLTGGSGGNITDTIWSISGSKYLYNNSGVLSWNETRGNLTYVTPSGTYTLTGKTFDADGSGNSITNIENADIKSGANIDAAKIGTGVISTTEFNYLNGVTSAIQTQIDAKGTLSNVVEDTTPQLGGTLDGNAFNVTVDAGNVYGVEGPTGDSYVVYSGGQMHFYVDGVLRMSI